jgi:hypothetical protein
MGLIACKPSFPEVPVTPWLPTPPVLSCPCLLGAVLSYSVHSFPAVCLCSLVFFTPFSVLSAAFFICAIMIFNISYSASFISSHLSYRSFTAIPCIAHSYRRGVNVIRFECVSSFCRPVESGDEISHHRF